jgi:hypothetical protein
MSCYLHVGRYSNEIGLVVGDIRQGIQVINHFPVSTDIIEFVNKAPNIGQEWRM